MAEMSDAEVGEVDLAVVAYRDDGDWHVADLPDRCLDTVTTIGEELRRYPAENGAIALIPAVIVGFTQGPWTGLGVLALYLAIQAFESYVLTPMVHSRESEVPAFLIFVSVVIGGALMGVLGALVALPIAIILHITYFELVKPWNRRRFGEPVDVNGAHTEVNAERGEPAEVGS